MDAIKKIRAYEAIDSRGLPTLQTEVTLECGISAIAEVPSGASTGKYEACEKRDNDNSRYLGKGVSGAIANVNDKIAKALVGRSVLDIAGADSVMISLDGTHNKSNLGANAILSVSIALAKAGALYQRQPLYRYLGGELGLDMPKPMMNILNGGRHADNNIDIQEFMIMPSGAPSFSEGVRMCAEVYGVLKNTLKSRGFSTGVGDEGGFAPSLSSDEDAIELILSAIELAGYKSGSDFMLALDVAASEWKADEGYVLPKRKAKYTADELIEYYADLIKKYPIFSIEDGLGEEDKFGWKKMTERLGDKVMLVGDDLFVTNTSRIEWGINERMANAVLIKPNQIGTVSETARAVRLARSAGYKTIMSHRSGDTADSFIADFAVALGCEYIKSGAPARAERTSKYNRLIRIENDFI